MFLKIANVLFQRSIWFFVESFDLILCFLINSKKALSFKISFFKIKQRNFLNLAKHLE